MTARPSGIRAAAEGAWRALQDALADHPATPCAGRNEWISERPEVREWAAGHCRGCPVIGECRQFAADNKEVHGVWAGRDHTNGINQRRKTR